MADAREGTGITTAGAGSVLGSSGQPGPRLCCQSSSPTPHKWPLDRHSYSVSNTSNTRQTLYSDTVISQLVILGGGEMTILHCPLTLSRTTYSQNQPERASVWPDNICESGSNIGKSKGVFRKHLPQGGPEGNQSDSPRDLPWENFQDNPEGVSTVCQIFGFKIRRRCCPELSQGLSGETVRLDLPKSDNVKIVKIMRPTVALGLMLNIFRLYSSEV